MKDDARILELILPRTGERDDGQRTLACADAFALSEEHDLELLDIARVCNRKDIRISRCQLGCFR